MSNSLDERNEPSTQKCSKKSKPRKRVQEPTNEPEAEVAQSLVYPEAPPSMDSEEAKKGAGKRANQKETGKQKKARDLLNAGRIPSPSYPFTLRPISHLWILRYMKSFGPCSGQPDVPCWYNIRFVGKPASNALELILRTFRRAKIDVKNVITLATGWAKGDWMFYIPRRASICGLAGSDLRYSKGYFLGAGRIPKIEFIVIPVIYSTETDNEADSVLVPIVLMGIPFYDSDLNLDQYLYEAITARNKNLRIRQVLVKERYMIRGVRTNDLRCHVAIDPSCVHEWDFENPMKLVLQGWDNDGVPRPEIWPVTMRHIDECSCCGSFFHLAEDGITEVECITRIHRRMLIERREEVAAEKAKSRLKPLQDRPSSVSLHPPLPTVSSTSDKKTNIGFIVTS